MAKRKTTIGKKKSVVQKKAIAKKGVEVKAATADDATAKTPTKFARWYEPFLEEEPEPDNRVVKLDIEGIAASDKTDEEAATVIFNELKKIGEHASPDLSDTLISYTTCCVVIQLCRYKTALLENDRENGKRTFFNFLAVKTIDTFLSFFNALDFYAGLRQINFAKTPSVKMEADHGFIASWDEAAREPIALVQDIATGKIMTHLLPLVTEALETFLNILSIQTEPRHYIQLDCFESEMNAFAKNQKDEKAHAALQRTVRDIAASFKVLQTRLRMREHIIYDEHPDWEVLGYEDESSGPYDCRESRRNLAMAARDYILRFDIPHNQYVSIADDLDKGHTDTPNAFINSYEIEYSDEVRKLLSQPIYFNFDDPVGSMINNDSAYIGRAAINSYLEEDKFQFCMKLFFYFNKRADDLAPNSNARKLWIRASAELFSNFRSYNDRFPINENSARCIVNLANAAAKEEWVEKQLDKKKSLKFEDIFSTFSQLVENTGRAATANEKMLSMEQLRLKLAEKQKRPHKRTDKGDMVEEALALLIEHKDDIPEWTAPQAAKEILKKKESLKFLNKWGKGYTAEEKSFGNFVRTLNNHWSEYRKNHPEMESGKQENS